MNSVQLGDILLLPFIELSINRLLARATRSRREFSITYRQEKKKLENDESNSEVSHTSVSGRRFRTRESRFYRELVARDSYISCPLVIARAREPQFGPELGLRVIKEGDKNPGILCSEHAILSFLASAPDEYTPLSAYFK